MNKLFLSNSQLKVSLNICTLQTIFSYFSFIKIINYNVLNIKKSRFLLTITHQPGFINQVLIVNIFYQSNIIY